MQDFGKDPFFQYATRTYKTSKGDVALPMFFYEAANFFALFPVPLDKARALTAGADMVPVEFGKGMAMAVVASFDYRKLSITPYLEVGLAIAAVPKGYDAPKDPMAALMGDPDNTAMGFYVVDLPVTTEQAVAAGIELWGFPKFKAEIGFKLDGGRFDGKTMDPKNGGPVYTLSGEAGLGVTMPAMHTIFFTRLNGKTLRIHAVMRGATTYATAGSVRLKVGDTDNVMARNLRSLGLGDTAPLAVYYSPALQVRLTEGAPLP